MKLIGLVGQPGSGKDTAAEYIAKHYNIHHIASGDVLREYIRDNNLGGLDRENMQRVVIDLLNKKGGDYLVKLALETSRKHEAVLISGLRHPAEGEFIRKHAGHTIAIIASLKTRYERISRRGREGDDISFEKFRQLELNENQGQSFNIGRLIGSADYSISNNGDFEAFIGEIDGVMSRLGFEKH